MRKSREFAWQVLASFFFVMFLLSLSLHIWNLRPWGTVIDHQKAGSWAELIAGLGTISAALVAYWGILFENRRARAAEDASERRTNTQVYSWLEPRETSGEREWLLCFENTVGIPIYQWSVILVGTKRILASSKFGPIRPKSSQLRIEELRGLAHTEVPAVRFTFTDPTGAVWTRTEQGRLLEESALKKDS